QRKEPKISTRSATCKCPLVPAVSAHPCHLPVPISATSMPHSAYQCTSMPHISAHLSCLSVSPISASQCHLSVPVSAAYQCPATYQCLLISAHHCHLSVPITAASLAHISEGEKSLIYKIL
ncbi:unnamed protein product, partial [Staurois parvus]